MTENVTAEKPKNRFKHVPVSSVRPPDYLIRQKPRSDNAKYMSLVEMVAKEGVLQPILVREERDPESGEFIYRLFDGFMRLSASQDTGKETIPAYIVPKDRADQIATSMLLNLNRIEMRVGDYVKALNKMLFDNPTWTEEDIGEKLGHSGDWVKKRLGLVNLPEHVLELLNEHKISISNGYELLALHKVAPEEVDSMLHEAQTMGQSEFSSEVKKRVKEIKDARRAGRKFERSKDYDPTPYPQSMATVKREWQEPNEILAVLKAKNLLDEDGNIPDLVRAGVEATMEWFAHMDPVSIAEEKKKFEAKKKEEEEKRKRRQEERALEKKPASNGEHMDATPESVDA